MESSTSSTVGDQPIGGTSTSAAAGAPGTGSDAAAGLADRAKGVMGEAGDKLADAGSAVRDKAGNLKATLADALASGAERLRQQSAGGVALAGAGVAAGSPDATADESRLAQTSNQLAGGMQSAADWLRDADLDGLKSGIERQVKEHPTRLLAVAIGVGYLLGKAFRK